jgi:hypothetical protein
LGEAFHHGAIEFDLTLVPAAAVDVEDGGVYPRLVWNVDDEFDRVLGMGGDEQAADAETLGCILWEEFFPRSLSRRIGTWRCGLSGKGEGEEKEWSEEATLHAQRTCGVCRFLADGRIVFEPLDAMWVFLLGFGP